MLEEYMHQLEAVIDKDEYDLSNFAEKIRKREEQLKLSSEQFLEEPQFITTEKKNINAYYYFKKRKR